MPLTQYTASQLATLDSFTKIENFRAKSFTFFNKKTGEIIVDAIYVDNNGKLVIKDKEVEVIITDLINRKKYITEEQDEEGNDILYFEDEFNERISIGQMYANVERFLNSNLIYWFHGRAERNLEGNLDRFIIEDIFDSFQELNINDESIVKDYVTKQYDYWKNKWHDIPCMEVETPKYTNNKSANISAKVVMKVRSDKPLYTGFRILDATTGLELSRTIHASKGQHGKEVTYTIPLSYQGPLPDSELPTDVVSSVLTYKDIANVKIEGDDGNFKTTPIDESLTAGVPGSRHLIKLQWIACDFASEVMNDGEVLESLTREFSPEGTTSLDVTVYAKTSSNLEPAEINGTLNFDEIEGDTFYQQFPENQYTLPKEYPIMLSPNKNVTVSVVSKTPNGFGIKTNRKVSGLKVDWAVTYYIDPEEVEDTLNDPNRTLNHFLFRDRDEVLDFCNELIKPGILRVRGTGGDIPPEGCECCDCCTDDEVDVVYEHIDVSPPPVCSLEDIITRIEEDNPGGLTAYTAKALELGVITQEDVDKINDYLVTGEICGDVTWPFAYAKDSTDTKDYSFNLEEKFQYLATIVVRPGNAPPSDAPPGDGNIFVEPYGFLEDIFNDKGLADTLTGGGGNGVENKVILNRFSGKTLYQTSFEHCKYSFEQTSVVTSKVVEGEESSEVFKILNADVQINTCDLVDPEQPEDSIVDVVTEEFIVSSSTETPPSLEPANFLSFESIFGSELFFSGLNNKSLNELKENMSLFNDAKKKGLLKLEHDRLRDINELPVQLLSNNKLRLDLPRVPYEVYFENANSNTLYSSEGGTVKTRINPKDGYLGIKAFRHNLLAFDPNPNRLFNEQTNPFFPTFNPIYNQKSYDQLLEYIYTAIYPSGNIPVFPNFQVGDFVINGAKYNPLYDLRNYRTFGFYQSFTNDDNNEQLFISDPISQYVPSIKLGRLLQLGDEYYQVKRDFNNSGPIFTNIRSDGVIQKVKPSGIIFKKVSQEIYDLNPSLQVTL